MLSIKSKIIAGLVLLSVCTLGGCQTLAQKAAGTDNVPTPPGTGRMPPNVADALDFGGAKTKIALAVNENGKVKAFVRDGVDLHEVTLPIHADNLLAIESIVVFRTSNPKVCVVLGGVKYCSGS